MNDLPHGNPEDFIGEFSEVDLSELKDKTFMVAQASGDPKGPKFVCSTIRGPYNFYGMCEEVGRMWETQLVHAKALIISEDRAKAISWVDECSIDYIEANYANIMMEELLMDDVPEVEYTHKARIINEDDDDVVPDRERERDKEQTNDDGDDEDEDDQ
jgi:hypothetical protein